MQLLESRAWPNKCIWVYLGTYICRNTRAEHFTVALKQCFQQNFCENSIPQRHVQHEGIRQWTRSRRGHWPGIYRHISRHIFSSQTGSLTRIPADTCQPQLPDSAKQGLGTGTSCLHQGQLQQTNRGHSFGLQPKFQSLLG